MNPAREALTRAVNKAIANGAPVLVNQQAPARKATPEDLFHLNAIDLRLSHERSRLQALKYLPIEPKRNPTRKDTKIREEIAWREHNVRMIEREHEGEAKFLAKHGIEVDASPKECELSLDEILAELEG